MNRSLLILFFSLLTLLSKKSEAFRTIEPRILIPAEKIAPKKEARKLSFQDLVLADWLQDALEASFKTFKPFGPEEVENHLNSDQRLACFRIRQGELFVDASPHWLRPEHKKAQGFCEALYALMDEGSLPLDHCDILVHMKDESGSLCAPIPIFCFARTPQGNYVLIPDYFSLSREKEEVIEEMLKADAQTLWETKKETAFWRGGANGLGLGREDMWKNNPRGSLVLFSSKRPDLVCAHFYCDRMKNACGELSCQKATLSAPWMSPGESCQYKYQIDVDGWTCAYHRCQWTLWSNCVPIKQMSPNIQWYYAGLKPYVHYLPYSADCSNLESQIQWLRKNDSEAKKIAAEGRAFCEENLTVDKCYLYLYLALKKYCALYTHK